MQPTPQRRILPGGKKAGDGDVLTGFRDVSTMRIGLKKEGHVKGYPHLSDTQKYELVGDLVDNPTRSGLIKALFHCAKLAGAAEPTGVGIDMEDHGRYLAFSGGRTDVGITIDKIEIVQVSVPEFLKLLTDMIDAGGLVDMWPGKIVVKFEFQDWDSIPGGDA